MSLGAALSMESNSAVGVRQQQTEGRRSPTNRRSSLYLFACHLEWCNKGKLDAYEELVAALDDSDENIRRVAENLLHRSSPRRQLRRAVRSGE